MWNEDTEPKVKVRRTIENPRRARMSRDNWHSKYIEPYLIELMHPLPMNIIWWNHYQKGYGQGIHDHDNDSNPKCLFGSTLYVCGASPTIFIEPDGRKIRPEVKDGVFCYSSLGVRIRYSRIRKNDHLCELLCSW